MALASGGADETNEIATLVGKMDQAAPSPEAKAIQLNETGSTLKGAGSKDARSEAYAKHT